MCFRGFQDELQFFKLTNTVALLEFEVGDFKIDLLLSKARGGSKDSPEAETACYSDSSQLLSVSAEIIKLRLKPAVI